MRFVEEIVIQPQTSTARVGHPVIVHSSWCEGIVTREAVELGTGLLVRCPGI
jgi:hypothetical protein